MATASPHEGEDAALALREDVARENARRFDREVRAEQLRLYCKQAIRIPIGVVILTGYVIYLFWNHVGRLLLVAWLLAVCGALMYRTWLSTRLLKQALSPAEVDKWTRFMVGFAFVNGALGGSSGIFFFPVAPLPEQALHTMLLAAWCAAAIATSGMMARSFYMFSVPLLAPIIVGWWRHDEHWFNAALLVAFLVYLMLYVRDTGRTVTEALHTRYENVTLVGELRERQAEAISARDKAESASRSKTQFLAAASHDLRQPLTALALFNRLLADRATDPEIRRIAGHIDESVTSLESLMSALLDISKLDAGTIQPRRVVISLADLFARLAGQYAAVAEEKGLAFSATAEDLWVDTDPVLLERIVRNLIENALRYTHKGGIQVRATGAGGEVILEVIDTGIGIPEAERSRIFEEFYQIRSAEPDAKQGLGLGLAIVQRMAHLLGCVVEVDSVVDFGSTFRVRMPGVECPADAPSRRPLPVPDIPDLAGIKVLVVDDEESIVLAMKGLLESWGCEVRAAASVDGAAAELDAMGERPDLMIVDFRLRNGETGIQIARAASERYGRIPAILVTGDTAPDRLREAAESGLRLLHKPVTGEALRYQIETLLELREH